MPQSNIYNNQKVACHVVNKVLFFFSLEKFPKFKSQLLENAGNENAKVPFSFVLFRLSSGSSCSV